MTENSQDSRICQVIKELQELSENAFEDFRMSMIDTEQPMYEGRFEAFNQAIEIIRRVYDLNEP